VRDKLVLTMQLVVDEIEDVYENLSERSLDTNNLHIA
jgi:hypothetical protein